LGWQINWPGFLHYKWPHAPETKDEPSAEHCDCTEASGRDREGQGPGGTDQASHLRSTKPGSVSQALEPRVTRPNDTSPIAKHSRQAPDAFIGLVRICAGRARSPSSATELLPYCHIADRAANRIVHGPVDVMLTQPSANAATSDARLPKTRRLEKGRGSDDPSILDRVKCRETGGPMISKTVRLKD
jgi:hypothetical protein